MGIALELCFLHRLRISNKYGRVTALKQTQPNIYVLVGGASNQVQRNIGQKFLLKSDINVNVNSYIRLNFNQSENVNL
jgi:hypothetical protein